MTDARAPFGPPRPLTPQELAEIDAIGDEVFTGPSLPLPPTPPGGWSKPERARRRPATRSSMPPVALTSSATDARAAGSREEDATEGARSTAELLAAIAAYVTRYVVLTTEQAAAIALWVLHTHTAEAHGITPYLAITSAEKASGKTTLLETLQYVVARPWLTGSVSAATLARKIDQETPTLLLDESDAAFKGDRDYAEALRGVLNSGFKASGTYSRCVGNSGTSLTVADFNTFCPKAIAGIGSNLPDTVLSRSIPIRLRRKTANEAVERFRLRTVEAEGAALRSQIEPWVYTTGATLADVPVALLDALSDRAFDVWEPLLAIANHAGGDWPESARAAAIALSATATAEDDSLRIRLLADIRNAIGAADRILSTDLAYALNRIEESPWGGFNHGSGITPREIAKHLKPFEITPRTIRDGKRTAKGYVVTSFDDAFNRYLPAAEKEPLPAGATPSQTAPSAENPPRPLCHTTPPVTAAEPGANPHQQSVVTDVTATEGLTDPQIALLSTASLRDIEREYQRGGFQ